MTEPDVALTDFGLAIECGVLASLLARRAPAPGPLRFWFLLFFFCVGVAALLGGVLHGFLLEAPPELTEPIWLVVLTASGAAALACWAIGGRILFGARAARWVFLIALLLFALYVGSVLFLLRDFRAVVIYSAAASLFLLAAFLAAYRRQRSRAASWGAAGAGLMLFAVAVQQSGLDLHPAYLTHNALYHLVVGIALYLLFRSAADLTRERT